MILYHGTDSWGSIHSSRKLGLTAKEHAERVLREYKIEKNKKRVCEKALEIYKRKPKEGKVVLSFWTSDIKHAMSYGEHVIAKEFENVENETMNHVHKRKIDVKKLAFILKWEKAPTKYIDRRRFRKMPDFITDCPRCLYDISDIVFNGGYA